MMIEWYVGFHAPGWRLSWDALGHVEIWGYTKDDTWVFIDPGRLGTDIIVEHKCDEVDLLLTERIVRCSEIWRLSRRGELSFPAVAPICCTSIVAHILGVRAFGFRGLRRNLRALGATEISGADKRQTGSQGTSGQGAGAGDC